jgi:hypothetical protein
LSPARKILLGCVSGIAGLGAAVIVPTASDAAANTTTASFMTPGTYSFTVPSGVTTIQVQAVGGSGGDYEVGEGNPCVVTLISHGGTAGVADATMAVNSGEILTVVVAGSGQPDLVSGIPGCNNAGGSQGGYGGGGSGGQNDDSGGGGGASAVLSSGTPLIVAGGGGGAGGTYNTNYPGGAGGSAGSPGADGVTTPCPASGPNPNEAGGGGGAGSDQSGGSAGSVLPPNVINYVSPTTGSFEQGGVGGTTGGLAGDGGGGGGGYYGGGGGGYGSDYEADYQAPGGYSISCIYKGSGGGGGGGSSYGPGGTTGIAPSGNPPSVTLTYTPVAATTTTNPTGTTSPSRTTSATTPTGASTTSTLPANGGNVVSAQVTRTRVKGITASLYLSCSGPVGGSCKFSAVLTTGSRHRTVTVGTARFAMATGSDRRGVRVVLNRRGRNLLARRRSVTAELTVLDGSNRITRERLTFR